LHGLSHEEAGALVGISASYFRTVERGAAPTTEDVVERFERTFGEPMRQLLTPVDVRNIPAHTAGVSA
jgi:transcriptional regulator with XRE-family HTH domain